MTCNINTVESYGHLTEVDIKQVASGKQTPPSFKGG